MYSNRKVHALLPCAGSSSRMGGSTSKLLVELRGRSIVEHTLRAIEAAKCCDSVIMMAPAANIEQFSALTQKINSNIKCIAGGNTRRASVWNGLLFLQETCAPAPDELIMVHDGARCFVSAQLIERCVIEALRHGAVACAMPVVDTLKRVDNHVMIGATVERDQVWSIQTPQVFRFDLLFAAHQRAVESGDLPDVTDDSTLVQALHPVRIVMGERNNIKITTPEDLKLNY